MRGSPKLALRQMAAAPRVGASISRSTKLAVRATSETKTSQIGLVGLAVMGQNLALNVADKGFSISVYNRSYDKTEAAVKRAAKEGLGELLTGHKEVKDFVESLEKPRRVIILVKAGAPVDSTIEQLEKYMEPGDIIIDGGNEWYENTEKRLARVAEKGLRYLGMGVSGGEEGARNGPSMMPGGTPEAYAFIQPIVEKVCAQVESGPCVMYVGPGGAGNFVKMIHNGIEYGDMQLISEAYDMLKTLGGLNNEELASVFDAWNKGDLQSFLIEISAIILNRKEDDGEGYILDSVMDKTGSKGTGKWTIQQAADLAVAAPTMAASLDARYMSALKDERVAAHKVYADLGVKDPSLVEGIDRAQLISDVAQAVYASKILIPPPTTTSHPPPTSTSHPPLPQVEGIDRAQLISDVAQALYASKICSYAQGMSIIKQKSDEQKWDVDLGKLVSIWKGGCIIRAEFLDDISKAYANEPKLANLLVDPFFAGNLVKREAAWRRVVTLAIANGVPSPWFRDISRLLRYLPAATACQPTLCKHSVISLARTHTRGRTRRVGSTRSGTPLLEALIPSPPASTAVEGIDRAQLISDVAQAVYASKILIPPPTTTSHPPPTSTSHPPLPQVEGIDRAQLISDVAQALYASKICSYAQGMSIIKQKSDEQKWDVDLGKLVSIWKGGCIIRAEFLDDISKAYANEPKLANLLVDPFFAGNLVKREAAWRRVVTLAIANGVPAPGFATSLGYFDTYRRDRLPANLVQAQRDFFGSHTYQRTDKEGWFHTVEGIDRAQLISDVAQAVYASKILIPPPTTTSHPPPTSTSHPPLPQVEGIDRAQLISDVAQALYASKICSYAQGMSIIKQKSDEQKWDVDLGKLVSIWKGGCIIRAEFLDDISKAYANEPKLANLLVDPFFAGNLVKREAAWRRVVTLAIANGVPAPGFATSLGYFDTYRRDRLPANLVQAQRDFFGSHTYQRTDKEGWFHTVWDPTFGSSDSITTSQYSG
eukprot:gene29410-5758_t